MVQTLHAAKDGATKEEYDGETHVLDYLLNAFSGPGATFMYAITGILAFALAILIERGVLLTFVWRPQTDATIAAIRAGDYPKGVSSAGKALAPVLEQGQKESTADLAWEAMSASAIRVESKIRKRLNYLSASGNIATMLGLLGTVYGLVVAFSSLGEAGQSATDNLSAGIATAMATTAYGLCVAIPCIAAHAWLEGRAEALLSAMEAMAAELSLAIRRGDRDLHGQMPANAGRDEQTEQNLQRRIRRHAPKVLAENPEPKID
ncbi:MAG: MotA/TolQ/ExbB proton channel family protein [Myxococcota bacterium]|jgi:biopolymer transport protein ExbB/TolQ|nr:MotA/TolQ/ExbB proton channel family protein [Myxococcota bacterium]